jgi:hypothetical protein
MPEKQEGHLMQEADIGSGEKKTGEKDTLKEVSKVSNPQMKEENERNSQNKSDKQQIDAELKDDPNYQARSKPHPER